MADTRIILKDVTLSYPHLDKPQQPISNDPNAVPKFSAALVLTEQHVAQVKAAALAAATEKWGPTKGPQMVTTGGKGSTIRTYIAGKYDGVPGAVAYISARNESRPGLVYREPDPATVTAENPKGKPRKVAEEDIRAVFYPGAKVNVDLTAFGYDKAVNKGVGFALNNIQKWAEGQRIDGRQAAEDAFEADLSAEPADLQALIGSK